MNEQKKCCKCGKEAEFIQEIGLEGKYFYCRECALNFCFNEGYLETVRLARTCDWCGNPLPDISLEAAGDSWYCSEECAIQGCDFEKIENKEK